MPGQILVRVHIVENTYYSIVGWYMHARSTTSNDCLPHMSWFSVIFCGYLHSEGSFCISWCFHREVALYIRLILLKYVLQKNSFTEEDCMIHWKRLHSSLSNMELCK
jgi:hypothetical protein